MLRTTFSLRRWKASALETTSGTGVTVVQPPRFIALILLAGPLISPVVAGDVASPAGAPSENLLFCIGTPDGHSTEFGLTLQRGWALSRELIRPVVFTVGRSKTTDWPHVQPGILDAPSGKQKSCRYAIRFHSHQDQQRPLFLILGLVSKGGQKSPEVTVTVGDVGSPKPHRQAYARTLPVPPARWGRPVSVVFPFPAGLVQKGSNTINILVHQDHSITYDYLALSADDQPLPIPTGQPRDLLSEFCQGPMAGVEEIVFVVRTHVRDGHWYANFGYYADANYYARDDPPVAYGRGGRLCRMNLRDDTVSNLLDDPEGSVRDPVIHYDGRKILFAYRRGGTEHYHLYEINIDGSSLRQLTFGPYDDIEPVYLPDGGIMFVSTRCRRWVNCWITQVANLHRCDADGGNIRALSGNIEHDNTPWVLPSGQILYTRWEYVDRSQLAFHHLWTMTPLGHRQMVFFGNLHPGIVMIDAKPIPRSPKVVASFSPGHGKPEHTGAVAVVDPRKGPDERSSVRLVSHRADFRDPWAFSEEAFVAARGGQIVLMDGAGQTHVVYELPESDRKAGLLCHEPRPLYRRSSERVVADDVDEVQSTGRLALINVYHGRNMDGVTRGETKKLLVIETLPKPINFSGGMEPLSYGGTFTLERILGTVPVESDGSAYFELPALRPVFFVALDENDLSVKRMRSFVSVVPGETTTCIGCHEHRAQTPNYRFGASIAIGRPASKIEPIADIPSVLDYPRDVQPILDRHCVRCHDYNRPDGGVILTGDRGPVYSISYYTITVRDLVADGRNSWSGSQTPRTFGSSASRLMKLVNGSHYEVRLSDREQRTLRLWIETGAAYPGTYAALGSGMITGNRDISPDRRNLERESDVMKVAADALRRRCGNCHQDNTALPLSPSEDQLGMPFTPLPPADVRRRLSRHLLYNLSRPRKSLILLAPLAKRSGGYESCGEPVFPNNDDKDYQVVLRAIAETKKKLDEMKRFDMPGFRPRPEYVREMKRFGILPQSFDPDKDRTDVYQTDARYWQSFHHTPLQHP